MLFYLIKRILFFIPTLFLISVFSFLLSVSAPGDPVTEMLKLDNIFLDQEAFEREYNSMAGKLKQDLPLFYFSMLPGNIPADLRARIPSLTERKSYKLFLWKACDYESVHSWFTLLDSIVHADVQTLGENNQEQLELRKFCAELKTMESTEEVREIMLAGEEVFGNISAFSRIKDRFDRLNNSRGSGFYLPKFYWNGFSNQYHHWILAMFVPSEHYSMKDGRPVYEKIGKSISWTLSMLLSALIIALIIGVILGVISASAPEKWWSRWIEKISFAIYAIPVFWLATICLVFLTSPFYGMKIFPSAGLFPVGAESGVWNKLIISAPQLILPVFCLVLHSLAFIIRQVKQSMEKELDKQYILAARARGLSNRRILWNHALRNASLPLVTLITGSIPSLVAGTLIIEVIFNIPGMGRLMFDSLIGKDWPVVFTIVNISGIITVCSYLLADIAYSLLDPRIKIA